MISMVRCASVILAKRQPHHDSVFANLKTLICKHWDPFQTDDLAALLSLCPKLVKLDVKIKDSKIGLNKIGPLLSSMSALKTVHLDGAGIEWLSFLRKCHRVSLDFSGLSSVGWMRDARDRAASSTSQEPALRYLTLRVDRYLAVCDISYVAEYLDAFIGNFTELHLQPGYDSPLLKRRLDELQSTMTRIRKGKANFVYKGPGFRLIEPATHTSINGDP